MQKYDIPKNDGNTEISRGGGNFPENLFILHHFQIPEQLGAARQTAASSLFGELGMKEISC